MSDPTDPVVPADGAPASSQATIFWAQALLSVAFFLLVGWQLFMGWQQYQYLRRQRDQGMQLVTQSLATQNALRKLALDLLELAKTDVEAKALIEKYKIAPGTPAPPSPR